MPEPTALTAKLDAAVRQHLPEKVGKLLRERLDELEGLEETVAAQAKRLEGLDKKNAEAKVIIAREDSVARKEERSNETEAMLVEKQQEVALKEAVCKAKDAMYSDMKLIVMAVFANNRFKYTYQENGTMAVCGPGGYPTQEPTSRNGEVEGEGAPPAHAR